MFIKFVDIDFFVCVILTLVCSLRACNMWLTRNQCLFVTSGENLFGLFSEILKSPSFHSGDFKISKK